jgi:hypothetical protein
VPHLVTHLDCAHQQGHAQQFAGFVAVGDLVVTRLILRHKAHAGNKEPELLLTG